MSVARSSENDVVSSGGCGGGSRRGRGRHAARVLGEGDGPEATGEGKKLKQG